MELKTLQWGWWHMTLTAWGHLTLKMRKRKTSWRIVKRNSITMHASEAEKKSCAVLAQTMLIDRGRTIQRREKEVGTEKETGSQRPCQCQSKTQFWHSCNLLKEHKVRIRVWSLFLDMQPFHGFISSVVTSPTICSSHLYYPEKVFRNSELCQQNWAGCAKLVTEAAPGQLLSKGITFMCTG